MEQPIQFQRIKVRISTSGFLYIGLTLMVGAAAVNTGNNLLYLLTAGLLGVMALSGVAAYIALRRLELELFLPREWFARRKTRVRIAVHNRRKRLPAFLLRIQRGDSQTTILEIPAGGTGEGDLHFRFPGRGEEELGELIVTSEFPFGFFRRGGVVHLGGRVLVYPEPLPLDLDRKQPAEGRSEGEGSSRPGTGGDYRGSREYQPGDSLSRVNWKIWGRLGRLTIKEFEEEGGRPLILTLDSVPGADVEEKLSRLTTLILEAHGEGRPVGLSLPGWEIAPVVGRTGRNKQLHALALYEG